MGKREKPTHRNIEYDSQEEIWFVIWLEEAKRNNFVHDWIYHPKEYELSPKVENEQNKMILRPHTYSPDFSVQFKVDFWHRYPQNPLIHHAESTIRGRDEGYVVREVLIDVKGKYARGKIGQFPNTGAVTFPLNQKWMYQKYGIFVNAVQPSSTVLKGKVTKAGFFSKTFVPAELAFNRNSKTLLRRKEFSDCRLLNEEPTIFNQ